MTNTIEPVSVDKEFFKSLIETNIPALEKIVSDDFILVDVMSGSEISKPMLLGVLQSGDLKFTSIEPDEVKVRIYGDTAVIVGRTQMKGFYLKAPFTTSSRYTHVYVKNQDRWQLVSAQGTQITSPPTG